jgi:hypothetical protein
VLLHVWARSELGTGRPRPYAKTYRVAERGNSRSRQANATRGTSS